MRRVRLLISLLVLVIAVVLFLFTQPPSGEKLFRKEGCIHCHRFKGEGGGVGPDLTLVTERHSDAWIKDQIHNAEVHNPLTQMPSFSYLSERDIDALLKYLKTGAKKQQ
jgi:mono/diheme cytochrome c family protein